MLVLNGRCNTSLVPHRKMTKDWQLNVLFSNTPITTTKWISKGGQNHLYRRAALAASVKWFVLMGYFPRWSCGPAQ